MNGGTVLNTRPRSQAAELSRLLRDAGFVSIEAPAIDIVPAWSDADLSEIHGDLHAGRYAWLVLASQNAAHGLQEYLTGTPLVCGTATARALGVEPTIGLDRFSASAALNALRPHVTPGERVLVPRAAEGRDELIDGLLAMGASVSAPVAYRTVAVPEAAARLGLGGIDAVALCSPSAAISVAPAVTRERVFCLGETTAAAARAAGLRVDVVATATSMTALVATIVSAVEVAA